MATRYYASKKYPFVRGGPIRLEVHWTYGLTETLVKLDGVEIGKFTSRKEFQQGQTFRLADRSSLEVKYAVDPNKLSPHPDVRLNGRPLPNSFADPVLELKNASNYFILGGILIFFGALVYSADNPGWFTALSLFIGITGPIIGVAIRRKSRLGLKFGIVYAVLCALSFLLGLSTDLGSGSAAFAGGIGLISNLFSLFSGIIAAQGLSKGFKAMDTLDLQEPGVKI
jgi:hypothetical protein